MTQEKKTFTVRHLHTGKDLGIFDTAEEARNFCQENKLTPVTIPHGHQFISPFPLPDSPTDFVMFAYFEEGIEL